MSEEEEKGLWRKRQRIEGLFSTSSVIDLKANLFEAQNLQKKRKIPRHKEEEKEQVITKKKTIFETIKNKPNVENRSENWKHEEDKKRKGKEMEREIFIDREEIFSKLEEKAKKYASAFAQQFENVQTTSLDDQKAPLVDFEQKMFEELKENRFAFKKQPNQVSGTLQKEEDKYLHVERVSLAHKMERSEFEKLSNFLELSLKRCSAQCQREEAIRNEREKLYLKRKTQIQKYFS